MSEPWNGPSGGADESGAGHGPERDPASLVADLFFGIERAEIDLPHIVLSRNAATGETSYSGPYASGLCALSAAEAQHTVEVDGGGGGQITFEVAALYAPLDIEHDTGLA